MRDGGKGDTPRPLGVPMNQFDNNWDAIFGKKKKTLVEEAPYQPGYEDAVEPSLLKDRK